MRTSGRMSIQALCESPPRRTNRKRWHGSSKCIIWTAVNMAIRQQTSLLLKGKISMIFWPQTIKRLANHRNSGMVVWTWIFVYLSHTHTKKYSNLINIPGKYIPRTEKILLRLCSKPQIWLKTWERIKNVRVSVCRKIPSWIIVFCLDYFILYGQPNMKLKCDLAIK